MEKAKLDVIDYVVLGGLLLLSSGIGVFFAWKDRKSKSNEDYLTGNRQLKVIPVSLSLMASYMSSSTVLGFPAEIYTYGTQFSLIVVAMAVALILASELFLPVLYPLKLTSVNEYLGLRFKSKILRTLVCLQGVIFQFPYLAVVLYGPSLALSSVTNLDLTTSILVVGLICTFYTTIGGIKAVIWTDVIQMILLFAGILIVMIQGCIQAGGFKEIWRIAQEGGRIQFSNFDMDLYAPDSAWTVILGMGLLWFSAYSSTQLQVQRYCSLPSVQKAKWSLYINIPGLAIILTITCFCGLILYANYHDCDPVKSGLLNKRDQMMPYFVLEILGHWKGLPGLFVACVFSGSLSTLSSGVAGSAAMIWDDLLKDKLNLSGKQSLLLTKATAAVTGLILVGVAFLVGRMGSVIQAGVTLSGAAAGPIFALFTLGVFFPPCNSKAAILGLICGDIACFTVACLSLAYGIPKPILPMSVDGCGLDIDGNSTLAHLNETVTSAFAAASYRELYYSKIHWLYDIHYLWTPVIGFLGSLFACLIYTCFSCNDESIDPKLLNVWIRHFYKKSLAKKPAKSKTKAVQEHNNSIEISMKSCPEEYFLRKNSEPTKSPSFCQETTQHSGNEAISTIMKTNNYR